MGVRPAWLYRLNLYERIESIEIDTTLGVEDESAEFGSRSKGSSIH